MVPIIIIATYCCIWRRNKCFRKDAQINKVKCFSEGSVYVKHLKVPVSPNVTIEVVKQNTTDELWGVFYEHFEENWPRYNGTALYTYSYQELFCVGATRMSLFSPQMLIAPISSLVLCEVNHYAYTTAWFLPVFGFGANGNYPVDWMASRSNCGYYGVGASKLRLSMFGGSQS